MFSVFAFWYIIKINYILTFVKFVYLWWPFRSKSKGRQRIIFDFLDVNQLDSSASKRQRLRETRLRHSDEQWYILKVMISDINDDFNSCIYKFLAEFLTMSQYNKNCPFINFLAALFMSTVTIINQHAHHE